ncbi:sulfotransferase family protein [Desulfosoma sp.]
MGILRPLWIVWNLGGLALDHVFYPHFTTTPVTQPVFIVGHPRSGTTLLHRLLACSGAFVFSALRHLVVPSLVGEGLLRAKVLEGLFSRRGVFPDRSEGHETGWAQAEEEEILLYNLGCSIHYQTMTPLGFSNGPRTVFFDERHQSCPLRRAQMVLLKGHLRRRLYQEKGARYLAKMPMGVFRIGTLMEAFPDCRLLYVVRSPHEAIGSLMTLQLRMLQRLYPSAFVRAHMKRYVMNQYEISCRLYRRMEEIFDSGAVPVGQIKVVRYESLKKNLPPVLEDVLNFCNVHLDADNHQRLMERAKKEQDYVPLHRNLTWESFGISVGKIYHELKDIYDKYGLAVPPLSTLGE